MADGSQISEQPKRFGEGFAAPVRIAALMPLRGATYFLTVPTSHLLTF